MSSEIGKKPSDFGLMFILPSGEEHLYTSLPINIGRSGENDLVVDHETVSAIHAQVFFDERIQDVCIQDRDSLNGLLIDNKPTRMNILRDGVKISLGEAVVGFRDTGYIHTHPTE